MDNFFDPRIWRRKLCSSSRWKGVVEPGEPHEDVRPRSREACGNPFRGPSELVTDAVEQSRVFPVRAHVPQLHPRAAALDLRRVSTGERSGRASLRSTKVRLSPH